MFFYWSYLNDHDKNDDMDIRNIKLYDLFGQGNHASTVSAIILIIALTVENKLGLDILKIQRPIQIGLAVFLFSLAIIIYAVSFKHLALLKQNKEFITDGPYKYVRHPRYSSLIFCVYPAFCLLFNSFLGLISTIFVYQVFKFFIRREEDYLIAIFGSRYEHYRKLTPAFIPNLELSKKNN